MKAFLSVVIMAGVTYLIRAIPVSVCQKQIKSRFIKSFLFYIPYAVLSAMTFPAIFYISDNIYSAIAGTVVALVLAYFEKSLMTVAIVSMLTVFVTSYIPFLK